MIVEVEHQRHDVDLIKIDNDETKIVFTNYGARIVSWKYHDNNIILGNVVEADEFYFENPLILVPLSVAMQVELPMLHLN